jgi:hypothetical protein
VIDPLLRDELLKTLDRLSPAMQRRSLDFVRALAETDPQGVPGDKLLQFSGIMTPEEAREFLNSIEEDCERINPNEW